MTEFSSCLSTRVFGRTRAGRRFLFQESPNLRPKGYDVKRFVSTLLNHLRMYVPQSMRLGNYRGEVPRNS